MESKDVDWQYQALEFLKGHGWNQELDSWFFHPMFPLGQELALVGVEPPEESGVYTPKRFCEKFYAETWKWWIAVIEGALISAQESEVQS